jgi:hypothetical protein
VTEYAFTADPEIERAHAIDVRFRALPGVGSTRRARIRESAIIAAGPTCNPHLDWGEPRPMQDGLSPTALLSACEAAEPTQIVAVWDCATFVTWTFHWSDCRDPNGLNFDGLGDTEIMLANEQMHPHYTENSRAMCGAIGIYFGGDLSQHAIVHLDEPGVTDPKVGSMGSNIGPLIIPKSWEDSAHPGQDFVWCSVGSLVR